MASTKPARPARASHPTTLDADAIRKMPPDDYMNEVQLGYFRRLLEERLRSMGYSGSITVPDPSEEQPIETGDRAFIEEERAIATSLIEHNAEQRAEIEIALRRIDDGSYGYCQETGDPIGIPRLLAYPAALYTVEIQERHERARRLGESPGRGGVATVADGNAPDS
jgi:DnaK suppressor protein